MDFRFVQAAVMELLEECPANIPEGTRDSLRANILAGEPELTFDAICSWIYELEVPISSSYFADLENTRGLLGLDSEFLDFLMSQVE